MTEHNRTRTQLHHNNDELQHMNPDTFPNHKLPRRAWKVQTLGTIEPPLSLALFPSPLNSPYKKKIINSSNLLCFLDRSALVKWHGRFFLTSGAIREHFGFCHPEEHSDVMVNCHNEY